MADNKENKNNKKLRYTVLMVPNNAHRVRQFHISFDLLISLITIFTVLVVGIVVYISGTVMKVQDLEERLFISQHETQEAEDANILLQAQIEELETTLHDAKVTLETTKTIQQQEAQKVKEKTIPTGFPVDNVTALASAYSDERQYVEFNTGMGSRVVAAADGSVVSVEEDPENGYVLTLDYGNGYRSIYTIKTQPSVTKGEKVIRGGTLFVVDGDNQVLSYQIQFNEVPIDPMTVIEING